MTTLERYIKEVERYIIDDKVTLALLNLDKKETMKSFSELLWSPWSKYGSRRLLQMAVLEKEIEKLASFNYPIIIQHSNEDILYVYEGA